MGNYTNQDCLNEIQKVSTVKLSIKTAIESKGVTVPADTTFAGYAELIEDIPQGKPEETLTQTITENGSHVFNPSEGHVFNSASITVEVPGTTPTGTINISDNGTYDVTDKATAVVAVGGKDYRYKTGTPDVDGLTAIGWTADDIGYYGANAPHYAWENDNYKVSQENIDLYSQDNPQPSLYKDNPNVTFVPNKNMRSYFCRGSAFEAMKYIKSIPWYDTSDVTNMTNLFYGCSSLQTIPLLDTSSVEQMYQMFNSCSSLTSIPLLDTSNVTNMYSMFLGCSSLTSIPQLDTSKVTDMNQMFSSCSSLTSIPQLDTSKVTNMNQMFFFCRNLKSVSLADTSSVTDMSDMFNQCDALKSVSLTNTSSVTSMRNLFTNCTNLTSIPQLDTSKVTNMYFMFYNCTNLTSIPQLDTSSATDMGSMFNGCSSLTSIPQLDTSRATSMNQMFYSCTNLKSVSFTNTSSAKDMGYMFGSCEKLRSVEGIDFSSLTSKPGVLFGWSPIYSLAHFIVKGSINFSWDSEAFDYTPNLNYESIKSILEAMNRTTNTDPKTMKFNSAIVDREGELAGLVSSCATKGWTVTGLTIKAQSMINSITPDKEHIVASDIDGMYSPKLRFTVDAREEFTGGGCPARHTVSNSVNCSFDYYNASTNEKVRDGKIVDSACATPSGTIGVTEFAFYIIDSENRPAPQSGEYALVGFTLKSTSEPYEFVDYYFKVYPDGE